MFFLLDVHQVTPLVGPGAPCEADPRLQTTELGTAPDRLLEKAGEKVGQAFYILLYKNIIYVYIYGIYR